MSQNNIQDEVAVIDIDKIISRITNNWLWFLIGLILMPILAFLYVKSVDPVYTVSSTIQIENNQDKGSGGISSKMGSSALGDLSSLMGMGNSNVDDEKNILQTKDLMEKVVYDQQLYIAYYDNNKIGKHRIYKETPLHVQPLFPIADLTFPVHIRFKYLEGDKAHVKIEVNDKKELSEELHLPAVVKTSVGNFSIGIADKKYLLANGNSYIIEISSILSTIDNFEKNLTVDMPKSSSSAFKANGSTLILSLSSNVPAQGVDILRDLLQKYAKSNLEYKNIFADSTISFINNRLKLVESDLTSSESGLERFKQDNQIADIKTQAEEAIKNMSDYQKKGVEIEAQLSVVQDMLHYAGNAHNMRPVPALLTTEDPAFLSLMQNYNKLLATRANEMLTYNPKHPTIVALDAQVDHARQDLVNYLNNIKKGLLLSRQQLNHESGKIGSVIAKVPSQERQFLSLSRQQEIKQSLYLYMLQRREELYITKASNLPGVRVIDRPRAESVPTAPKKKIIYIAAILLGLILPYILLFLKELFDRKVQSQEDIDHVKPAPLLGEILHAKDNLPIDFINDTRSPISEQFRSLRTNLQFLTKSQAGTPVILFTSSVSGEGKSFIALNLARVYASLGKKVIMVDLDLRRPRLAENMSVKLSDNGFTNYIVNDLSLDKVITSTNVPNFDMIISGPIPPNPLELLQEDKTRLLVEELRKRYDIVILDTAPVGLVSDAQVLTEFASVTLFVVRERYSYKYYLNRLKDLINDKKLNNTYIVFNDVKPKKGNAGYGYGYGYGYGMSKK